MASSVHSFPSPVGGVPFALDFAPSVLFSVLYGLLVPIVVWRIANSRTRTFVLMGTMGFTVERVVAYALRANAAHVASARESKGLETYFQTTLNNGYLSIGLDLLQLTRALLVHATLGAGMRPQPQLNVAPPGAPTSRDAQSDFGSRVGIMHPMSVDEDGAAAEDRPQMRALIRGVYGIGALLFLVAMILSIVAGADYHSAISSGAHASLIMQLRYVSAALALFLLVGVVFGAVWVSMKLPRVSRTSVLFIVIVAFLLSVVSIYRLVILRFSTTSLISTAPGSLNSSQSKITFYVFQVAPELVAAAILVSLDVRRMFATGLWGDRRSKDPKPKVVHS